MRWLATMRWEALPLMVWHLIPSPALIPLTSSRTHNTSSHGRCSNNR